MKFWFKKNIYEILEPIQSEDISTVQFCFNQLG